MVIMELVNNNLIVKFQRYLSDVPASPPRGRGFPDHPLFGFPFGGHHGHHHGHRGHHRGVHRTRPEPESATQQGATSGAGTGRDSDGDSGEDQRFPNGCPYYAGKKGMKKWSKVI